MDFIDENYIRREQGKAVNPAPPRCMFCSGSKQLTKEHILPRWVFQKNTEAFFNITVNGLDQTYNKATVPACGNCNSDLLNKLERSVQRLLTERDVAENPFDWQEIEELIRWLELLDYKFQLYNITRQFKYSKTAGDIKFLRDFPLYMILPNKDYSPYQVLSAIRKSLKRLSVANKYEHLNSLVVFKTSNKGFHFFHTIDEFIFLEMPQFQIALFYFYRETFKTTSAAHERAMEVIRSVY